MSLSILKYNTRVILIMASDLYCLSAVLEISARYKVKEEEEESHFLSDCMSSK